MEAKIAQVTSENANSSGPQKRQISEPNEQQSDKSEQQLSKMKFLMQFGGQKNDILSRRWSKSFFKNMHPAAARSILFKT